MSDLVIWLVLAALIVYLGIVSWLMSTRGNDNE